MAPAETKLFNFLSKVNLTRDVADISQQRCRTITMRVSYNMFLKCHFQNAGHHQGAEGLQDDTSRWLQPGRFNTTAATMSLVMIVMCYMFRIQLNSYLMNLTQ